MLAVSSLLTEPMDAVTIPETLALAWELGLLTVQESVDGRQDHSPPRFCACLLPSPWSQGDRLGIRQVVLKVTKPLEGSRPSSLAKLDLGQAHISKKANSQDMGPPSSQALRSEPLHPPLSASSSVWWRLCPLACGCTTPASNYTFR